MSWEALTAVASLLSSLAVLAAVLIAANTTYIISWPDGRLYWAPSGFTALASGAGLTFSVAFRQ